MKTLKCKDCKWRKDIENTSSTNQAICTKQSCWMPVSIDNNCLFLTVEPIKCKDCDRYGNDSACMTANAEDEAIYNGHLCPGFIDKDKESLKEMLWKWKLRGEDYNVIVSEAIKEIEDAYDTF